MFTFNWKVESKYTVLLASKKMVIVLMSAQLSGIYKFYLIKTGRQLVMNRQHYLQLSCRNSF